MTRTQARNLAYTAAAAGVIANALFIAFCASFAVQRSTEPTGVGRLQRLVAWLSLDEGRLSVPRSAAANCTTADLAHEQHPATLPRECVGQQRG
jgi:hypothetical protein